MSLLTAEDAELERSRLVELRRQFFCPLIKDQCRVDCVCFDGGNVMGTKAGVYYVVEVGCQNGMFEQED